MLTRHTSLAALAFVCASTGPTLSQSLTTQPMAPGLGVFDATGSYIGNILDQNKIWLRLRDIDLLVKTDPLGAFVADDVLFYYESSNCTGDAYLEASGIPKTGAFVPAAATGKIVSRGKLFYPARPFEWLTANSAKTAGARQCSTTFKDSTGYTWSSTYIWAGKAVDLLLTGYTGPLSIR